MFSLSTMSMRAGAYVDDGCPAGKTSSYRNLRIYYCRYLCLVLENVQDSKTPPPQELSVLASILKYWNHILHSTCQLNRNTYQTNSNAKTTNLLGSSVKKSQNLGNKILISNNFTSGGCRRCTRTSTLFGAQRLHLDGPALKKLAKSRAIDYNIRWRMLNAVMGHYTIQSKV